MGYLPLEYQHPIRLMNDMLLLERKTCAGSESIAKQRLVFKHIWDKDYRNYMFMDYSYSSYSSFIPTIYIYEFIIRVYINPHEFIGSFCSPHPFLGMNMDGPWKPWPKSMCFMCFMGISWWFNGELMVINGSSTGFNGDLMVISWWFNGD